MTTDSAVPPPVPPEIVEKAVERAAWAVYYSGKVNAGIGQCRRIAEAAVRPVYGDIVEAARRDALTEAARLLADDGELDAAYTVHELAGLLCAEDSDATAPPRAPSATVGDDGAESGSTSVRDLPGPQIAAEGFGDE